MKNKLPRIERAILRAVDDLTFKHRRPPTIREIQVVVGASSENLVWRKLKKLEEKGYISRGKPHKSRQLAVLRRD